MMKSGRATPRSNPVTDLVKKVFFIIPKLSRITSIKRSVIGINKYRIDGALILLNLYFKGYNKTPRKNPV